MELAYAEDYFLSVLREAGIDCGDEMPDDVYERTAFVRVLKVSGTEFRLRQAETATIDLDVYAHGSKSAAYDLGNRAVQAIRDSVGRTIDGTSIGVLDVIGGYYLRDTGEPSEVYRYYWSLSVAIHSHPNL